MTQRQDGRTGGEEFDVVAVATDAGKVVDDARTGSAAVASPLIEEPTQDQLQADASQQPLQGPPIESARKNILARLPAGFKGIY